ncbi:MAG: hypothetical protein IIA87_04835 [Nanoarchaeota archaeon]|nr:hypothetical protein [Nanoarchaeota archaeon]
MRKRGFAVTTIVLIGVIAVALVIMALVGFSIFSQKQELRITGKVTEPFADSNLSWDAVIKLFIVFLVGFFVVVIIYFRRKYKGVFNSKNPFNLRHELR